MILEISCEVRDRTFRGSRQTFVASADSLNDVPKLIADKFPGAWCPHVQTRVIEESPKRGRPKRG